MSLQQQAQGVPRRVIRLGFGAAAPIWLYTVLLVAGSVALWHLSIEDVHGPLVPGRIPWLALAPVFYLAESYVIHIHFRRQAHTVSLNEVGLVSGLFLVEPGGLLAAMVIGSAAALGLRRRQPPVKLAWNLAQFGFTTSVAIVVFSTVSRLGDASGPAGWVAAILATSVASLAGIVLVTIAIAVAEHELELSELPTTTVLSVVATVATTSLALVALVIVDLKPFAIVLLIVPSVIVFVAFRAYVVQRRRHEHLEFLYQSMQTTQSAPEFGLAIGQLLIAVRRLVRAEYAEILLFPTETDAGLRSTINALGEIQTQSGDATACADLVALAGEEGKAVLVPVGRSAHPLDGFLAERGLPDAMITVLRGDDGPFGVLVAGDRAGDIGSFTEDDRALLETFSGHASVLLQNGRLERSLVEVTQLKEQLHHQAFHDALTGLPNRALFAECVEAALVRTPEPGRRPALLFVDLDDFKAVNDACGHAVGDALLVEVAQRVTACLRPGDTPARLGGDEFAALLESATEHEARTVGERILGEFERPFEIDGRELRVHASVGIAPATRGMAGSELIRNADVAMYTAKAQGKHRAADYEPSMHLRVRRRHELALELERAIERSEIEVAYQPIVSLEGGGVVAFEALARWHHPYRGVLMPAEFIRVADEIGLMVEIGTLVLAKACRRAAAWQQAFPEHANTGVTVNLSPTELADPHLHDLLRRTLLETCLAPEHLTLEITESSAMREADLAVARLHGLRDLGVKLALDDFGTGHSSLARLDEIPVHMLKIAKPFVDRLASGTRDASLVGGFLQLARAMSLTPVAEGIEHPVQARRLLELGCGLGQGFLFARPIAEPGLDQYLGAAHLLHVPAA
jgi:diguanylate cyclase (GGDEF)-like protein